MVAFKRDYIHAASSIWYKKLADNATLASTSADYVARLSRQVNYSPTSSPVSGPWSPPFTTPLQVTDYTFPIYRVPLDQPRVKVSILSGGVAQSDSYGDGLAGIFNSVPVPDINQCKPGSNRGGSPHQIESNGSDQSCAFVCGNELWEFWKFQPDTNNPGQYTCQWGGYARNIYTWSGIYRKYWGVHAAGVSGIAGMINAEDEARGTINHALKISLACTGQGASTPLYVAPVMRGDTGAHLLTGSSAALDADRIPEGSRFRLPATFDIDGYVNAISNSTVYKPFLKEVCKALRDYGMIAVDATGGVCSFLAEDSRTFGTPYNPYETRPGGLGNLQNTAMTRTTLFHIPWTSLVQLEPVNIHNRQHLVRVNGVVKRARIY